MSVVQVISIGIKTHSGICCKNDVVMRKCEAYLLTLYSRNKKTAIMLVNTYKDVKKEVKKRVRISKEEENEVFNRKQMMI